LNTILENSKDETVQIKVLEILLPMINPDIIHFTETVVENVKIKSFIIYIYYLDSYNVLENF